MYCPAAIPDVHPTAEKSNEGRIAFSINVKLNFFILGNVDTVQLQQDLNTQRNAAHNRYTRWFKTCQHHTLRFTSSSVPSKRNTGGKEVMRGLATHHKGKQKPVMDKDKVGGTQVSLGRASPRNVILQFPSVLWHCWLGNRKGTSLWFVGDDLSKALYVLKLRLSPPLPSSLAPIKSRMETLWYQVTNCPGKWPLNKCHCRNCTQQSR